MLEQQISPAKDEIHNAEEEMKRTDRLSAQLDVFQLRNSTSRFVGKCSRWKHNFKNHLVKKTSEVCSSPKDVIDG